ncbi:MAG TPA: hypothetical protein VK308_08475 [Pyrinomonadaceae bacterium]|nr:hypothetical protein [Pyrinomonadaceae bacterium]
MHKTKVDFSSLAAGRRFVQAIVFAAALFAASGAAAQNSPASSGARNGIALSPARVELEMSPGTETTLVLNLDYQTSDPKKAPSRIVAGLNDWDISPDGQINFYKSGTLPFSAGGWLTFTPAETVVAPNRLHSIRVTVAVPASAAPGDYLTALVIEQRPDNLKLNSNARTITIRYRMAAVFYIKIPKLEKRGSLVNLNASELAAGISIVPTLKNEGNTALRPAASVNIVDSEGRTVAEMPEKESLPILRVKELRQPLLIEKKLPAGTYTVKYRVDFNDGRGAIQGQTKLIVKETEKGTYE